MLAFAQKFPQWSDFPKGLHVLVVDENQQVLDDVKFKLEACDYLVTAFAKGNDALEALQDRSSSFHVALVEATVTDGLDGFKIVEAGRHLPTIMMSNTENMAIMMQGIAAGASEFLQKPLSEEKLKNIWQHVVRKALCTGELVLPDYLLPTKSSKPLSVKSESESDSVKPQPLVAVKAEPLEPALKSEPSTTDEIRPAEFFIQEENDSHLLDVKPDLSSDSFLRCGRFPGPSTPQLEQAGRITAEEDASDDSPFSHDFTCVKTEVDESTSETFAECDSYLQVKSEMEESSNFDELLDAKTGGDVLDRDEFESLDPELCADLQFDDLQDSLDDIALSDDLVVDGDVLSGIDMDSSILDGLPSDEALDMSMGCLDEGDLVEADEEALLLAEVAIAEKGLSGNNVESSKQMGESGKGDGTEVEEKKETKKSDSEQGGGSKGSKNAQSKRKMKVDWTPELHRRFVQAVEQLGVDKAIPSRILELMGVQCLTRHNIASHLQKYRSHRKHLLAREAEAASWNQRRQIDAAAASWARSSSRRDHQQQQQHHHHHHHGSSNNWIPSSNPPPIQPRPSPMPQGLAPIQPHPPPHAHHLPLPPPPPLHVWGHPSVDHSAMHLWQKPPVPAAAWQAPDGTFWQQPAGCLDAWGHPAPAPGTPFYPQPMLRLPLAPMPGVANMAIPVQAHGENHADGKNMSGFHPAKETVDAAINEVLRNPCTPLPLGLKPPSLESVIAELHRQGITTIPPASS